eukprot:TRINITY_DN33984_c0_g1_i1.p1 TRINITY_DN33984_c0_g1~~TRINITY_DN33984_c0_g1_i1.p1  ORF type:complete len:273 (+),score=59.24 TRINITY_DN33984_c0_g1_i1:30-821(+)
MEYTQYANITAVVTLTFTKPVPGEYHDTIVDLLEVALNRLQNTAYSNVTEVVFEDNKLSFMLETARVVDEGWTVYETSVRRAIGDVFDQREGEWEFELWNITVVEWVEGAPSMAPVEMQEYTVYVVVVLKEVVQVFDVKLYEGIKSVLGTGLSDYDFQIPSNRIAFTYTAASPSPFTLEQHIRTLVVTLFTTRYPSVYTVSSISVSSEPPTPISVPPDGGNNSTIDTYVPIVICLAALLAALLCYYLLQSLSPPAPSQNTYTI